MSYYNGEPDLFDDLFDWLSGPFKRAAVRKQERKLEQKNVEDRAAYAQGIREALDKDNLPSLKLFLSFLATEKKAPSGDQNPQIMFHASYTTPKDIKAFMSEHGAKLVYYALKNGKLENFAPVYEAVKMPNMTITETWSVGENNYQGTIPLLYEAINLRKIDIAGYIAKDPAVDITQKCARTGKTSYERAKEIMEKGEGMKEVVATLSERIANMKTQEADQLLAQATRLRDEMPKP